MPQNLDQILEEHSRGLDGIHVALVGNSAEGTVLAAKNCLENKDLDIDAVAAYASDLINANERFCHIFDPGTAVDFVLGGSKDNKLLMRAIPDTPYFVVFVVDAKTTMKDILPRLNKVLKESEATLPAAVTEEKNKAQALVEYAKRYAPDPTFVLMRLALKTGIAPNRLERAELEDSELQPLYDGIKDILGIERLPISI